MRDGRKLTGRRSIALRNPAYAVLRDKGVVPILSTLSPRFPVSAEDGSVTQRVRVRHAGKDSVSILGLARYVTYSDGRRGAPQTIDAATMLGTARLPSGTGVEANVTLESDPQVQMVTYELVGRTDAGIPARGSFSVLRPAALPTKENSTPVDDPQMQDRIRRAARLLGSKYVTDEDLRHLEAEGLL
jgi:hypothetical protein